MQKREPSTLFSIFQMTIEKAITIFEKDRDHDRNFDDTDSIKLNRLGYNTRMYWTNFWQPNVHIQQKFFEKNLIEAYSSHLYASFGIFCAQIGQLFEAQWVFETRLEIHKWLVWKENVVDFGILPKRMFKDSLWQYGRKRYQKKRKDVNYKLLEEFFQKKNSRFFMKKL